MTDQPSLRLYGYWLSMAAYRVRAALNVKGLAAEEVALDITAGDQFAPEFLAVNPEGAVPALVVNDAPALTQSMAILEYLEERFPKPPLLPADPAGRARVRSLCALVAGDTHPLITPRVTAYLKDAGMDAQTRRAWGAHWIARGFEMLETRLGRDPQTGVYCHGDAVTLADVCVASLAIPGRVLGFDLAPHPTVARIVAACETLEAFAKADPSRQLGAPAG